MDKRRTGWFRANRSGIVYSAYVVLYKNRATGQSRQICGPGRPSEPTSIDLQPIELAGISQSMFDSKKAKWIVWGLGAWLALVEAAVGQETSVTDQADEVLQQAEPVSGAPCPGPFTSMCRSPLLMIKILFFQRLTGFLPRAQIP